MRAVASRFGVSLSFVQRWVQRAGGRRLDRVDWEGLSSRPRRTSRTDASIEQAVLDARTWLRDSSVLGEYGPDAIRDELSQRQPEVSLARATVARILKRHGAIEPRRRVRRKPPAKGWYLPEVARREQELDSFDYIEDLALHGGLRVHALTAISLHGGLPGAFLHPGRSARATVDALIAHWRQHGLPGFAQFDNDTVFQGAHQHPDSVGRVTRLCLSLGVTPVFAVPREHGPQNAIEGHNALWKQKLWHRREWASVDELVGGSALYIDTLRRRRATRLARAPDRAPFPDDWTLDLNAPFRQSIIYLRRLDERGRAHVLGHPFTVSRDADQRRVRAVVDLTRHEIRFFALNRSQPAEQPLLLTVPHRVVQKRFKG